MLRSALIVIFLTLSKGEDLYNSQSDDNGDCYGYYNAAGNDKKWCWLTTDGKTNWAKHPQCGSYDGYSSNDYCKNAKYMAFTGSKLSDGYCYGRYENGKKWCWQTNDGKKDYAKHSCSSFDGYSALDYCETNTEQQAKAKSSGLGAFIAKWTKSTLDTRVRSAATGYRQTECWDLGMRAIEEARKAGYKIPNAPSSYVWSKQTVNYKAAQPGDIAQFSLWAEKITYPGGWSTRSTGYRHTAVVTKAYDESKCEIEMYDQNPKKVHVSKYHPCHRTGGSMIIYRLSTSSRLYEDDASWPVPEEFQQHFMLSTPLLCAVALATVGFLGLGIWRIKGVRAKKGELQLISTEEELEDSSLE